MENTPQHKDFLGNVLAVGDRVIYIQLNYREFRYARIEKFTKSFVFLQSVTPTRLWAFPTKQFPHQLIKAPTQ